MRRSPQEKKALSYARDRRNAFGESDKGSRKAIPLRKRKVNRANRHAARQQLDELGDRVVPERAERVEERVQGTKPKTWRKWPDEPLGRALERKRQRRAEQQSGPGAAPSGRDGQVDDHDRGVVGAAGAFDQAD
jgi:hypothetical protein